MKRDIYAYITTFVLMLAIGFSVFLIISDNHLPFTTQATVKTSTIEVVPEAQGYIDAMMVKEGQRVSAGAPLLQIDKTAYEIAQQKAIANAQLAKNEWQQSQRYLARVTSLHESNSISRETLDETVTATESAHAEWLSAQADLKSAQRNLDKTLVVAKQSGVVTNLAYRTGMYVSQTSSVIHLVDKDNVWIAADFTEKGLSALTQGKAVNIVFDAVPNKVFKGHVVSVDSAITSGVADPSQLATITDESRWIRAQQKIRVRIVPDTAPSQLVAGSRASVMVRDSSHVSDVWMTLLSWMRYIY